MSYGGELTLHVDNEGARAALREGTATNKVALLLIDTSRAVVARYDVAIWVERVPTYRTPAKLPSR